MFKYTEFFLLYMCLSCILYFPSAIAFLLASEKTNKVFVSRQKIVKRSYNSFALSPRCMKGRFVKHCIVIVNDILYKHTYYDQVRAPRGFGKLGRRSI